MISYILAKQLKDGGFPSPEEKDYGRFDSWVLKSSHGKAYTATGQHEIILFPGHVFARELVYIPTLSELIEACGWNECWFSAIHQVAGGWRADGDCLQDDDEHPTKFIEETGLTPEEAVANLWLALQIKK